MQLDAISDCLCKCSGCFHNKTTTTTTTMRTLSPAYAKIGPRRSCRFRFLPVPFRASPSSRFFQLFPLKENELRISVYSHSGNTIFVLKVFEDRSINTGKRLRFSADVLNEDTAAAYLEKLDVISPLTLYPCKV